MSLGGLSLPTVLGAEPEETPVLLEKAPPRRRKRRGNEEERESDMAHEAFYERMQLTREVEGILQALYRDFLTLRLGPAWSTLVVPVLQAWSSGRGKVDPERYRAGRQGALALTRRKPPRAS